MSIFKNKKNGMYYVQIMKNGVYVRGGKGFDSKSEAREVEHELKRQAKLTQAGERPIGVKLFIELWVEYLNEQEHYISESWYKSKSCIGARYFEAFAERYVDSITAKEIIQHMIERKNKVSARSANLDFEILKAFFMWLEKRGHLSISGNPFRQDIKKFPVTPKEKEIPSSDTIEKLISTTGGIDHLLILLLAHTAARINELYKLQWTDVDMDRKILRLRTRKTRNGVEKVREIPIGSRLLEALRGIERHTGYVLQHDGGKQYHDLRDRLSKILKRAGVEGKPRFHIYRSYGISAMLEKGSSLTAVRDLAGHTSIKTTNIYAKSTDRAKVHAIETLDQVR